MGDQLNNSQNVYMQKLIAYEEAKMVQHEREQAEQRKKEQELQAKQMQVEAKKKSQAIELSNMRKTNDKLVNEYLDTNYNIEDDGIDGRMVRQLISHGRKAKDSITYRVNANRNLDVQAQKDELYEQSQKQWWGQSQY